MGIPHEILDLELRLLEVLPVSVLLQLLEEGGLNRLPAQIREYPFDLFPCSALVGVGGKVVEVLNLEKFLVLVPELADGLFVEQGGAFCDDCLRHSLPLFEKGPEHALEVLHVHRLQQEEGEGSKIHVPADAHQGSHVPAVEVALLIDCKEDAVRKLLVVGLHLLTDEDDRLGDATAIPLEPRGHGLGQHREPLPLELLDDLIDLLAVVELVAVLDPFLGLREELLAVLFLDPVNLEEGLLELVPSFGGVLLLQEGDDPVEDGLLVVGRRPQLMAVVLVVVLEDVVALLDLLVLEEGVALGADQAEQLQPNLANEGGLVLYLPGLGLIVLLDEVLEPPEVPDFLEVYYFRREVKLLAGVGVVHAARMKKVQRCATWDEWEFLSRKQMFLLVLLYIYVKKAQRVLLDSCAIKQKPPGSQCLPQLSKQPGIWAFSALL